VKLNLYQQIRIQLRPEFSLSNSTRQDLLAKKIKVLCFAANDFVIPVPTTTVRLLWSARLADANLS
jgi:hypothetical protein